MRVTKKTRAPTARPNTIMRARLRGLIPGLCCCLISASVAFSQLAYALVTSSIGTGDDGAGHTQMEHHAFHGHSMAAMLVAETALGDGGVSIHCNQFDADGACMLLCSACLSALSQPSDALKGVPRNYDRPQHYAGVNPLLVANPPFRPPRH